jgi:hypothetical protein
MVQHVGDCQPDRCLGGPLVPPADPLADPAVGALAALASLAVLEEVRVIAAYMFFELVMCSSEDIDERMIKSTHPGETLTLA